MTFADLAQKILNEATPDPRGLKTSTVGRSDFNPQLPEYSRKHPVDSIGTGGTFSKKMLRNAFRLLRNDADISSEINSILANYTAKRKTINHDDEVTIRNSIGIIDDKTTKLNNYTKALQDHNEGKTTLSDPEKVKEQISTLTGDIKDIKGELKDVLNRVEYYAEDNEVLEHNLRRQLIRATQHAANNLVEKLKANQSTTTSVKSLDELDQLVTTDAELQQQETKLAVLKSLSEDSSKTNILIKFLDLQLNKYEEYKSGLSMSGPLATIELNKEFNRLPLSVFAMFYNANVKDAGEIKLQPMTAGAKALQGGFAGSQAGRKAIDKPLIDLRKLIDRNFDSKDAGVERRAFGIIDSSSASPEKKDKLKQAVAQVLNGETPPATLANIIYNESIFGFDILVEDLLTEAKKGARCTKVTGQQSSTRSDKKYMRCVRVNGKLKRIHYGDPNLRIKKSNPKRRKSFRARHKCSTAKPGTPKYYSCKNWSIIGFLAPAGLLLSSLCNYLPF